MHLAIQPILALVIGILVLLKPEFLNYLVGVYLIVIGVLGLMGR
jgi:threonine/homoserine efflux transporter RhtA